MKAKAAEMKKEMATQIAGNRQYKFVSQVNEQVCLLLCLFMVPNMLLMV